jgi:1-acyl-sn-glycerol-3-phosphate acyltransferase
MKIIRVAGALVRTFFFMVWAVAQIPFLIIFSALCRRLRIWQFHVWASVCARIFGIRAHVDGKIAGQRPLLMISNHISVFELVAFPALFGCGFFAKGEIKKYPLVGWIVGAFGNLFIDRRPSRAMQTVALIEREMARASNPFVIFPEGTTDNGAHVLPFKSAMFDFIANGAAVQIQPVVIFYRDKSGNKIPPQVLADEYAFFVNAKQNQPPYAAREWSVAGILWKNMVRGGLSIEIRLLPVFDPKGMDRKEIAARLHEIVLAKFQEFQ